MGGWLALSKGYQALVHSRVSNWHAKTVAVSGVTGNLQKELVILSKPYEGHPFSIKDAVVLREKIMKQFPMLTAVRVKRKLFNGTLSVSAKHRMPVAKFILPDKAVRYIDEDSTVYTDPNPDTLSPLPLVELEGKIPEKLGSEFVDLVQSALRLEKQLSFAFLRMNVKENTVKMYMPDGCVIDFGAAVQLKKKATRAAQILAHAKDRYAHPFVLNFRFFDKGKVFLTQKAH